MNIELLKPVEIRGELYDKGAVVEISKPQGEWLIAREAAKATKKTAEEAKA